MSEIHDFYKIEPINSHRVNRYNVESALTHNGEKKTGIQHIFGPVYRGKFTYGKDSYIFGKRKAFMVVGDEYRLVFYYDTKNQAIYFKDDIFILPHIFKYLKKNAVRLPYEYMNIAFGDETVFDLMQPKFEFKTTVAKNNFLKQIKDDIINHAEILRRAAKVLRDAGITSLDAVE